MVVQLVLVGLLVSVCAATHIQYPKGEGKACILIDLESNNSLSWTPDNGTEMAIPNWNISNIDVTEGNCKDSPYLVIIFHEDNATMRFDFQNATDTVNVKMTLDFKPDIVFGRFNNTDSETVSVKVDLGKAGSTEKGFMCNAEQTLNGKNATAGNDVYSLTLRTKNLKIQGFGVENGTYSKDMEDCAADITTVQPNTTVTTEPHTTEPHTTEPPKPTPAPTKAPTKAPTVTLNATDGNITCAKMHGAFTFMIPYNTTDKKLEKAKVVIPKDVNSSGNCSAGDMTNRLMATFDEDWDATFVFKGDKDNIWLDQVMLTVKYDDKYFPKIENATKGTNKTFTTNFTQEFKAKKDGSYLCNSDTTIDLIDGLQMETTDFQYTALQANVTGFSDSNVAECSADAKTSSIVPIAVGAALAGLVVIVLIAYLIGRRRNRKGYESV